MKQEKIGPFTLKNRGDSDMPIKLEGVTFYTVEELAKTLDCAPLTVRNYIKQGKVQAKKFGKKWIISGESVKQYLLNPSPQQKGK